MPENSQCVQNLGKPNLPTMISMQGNLEQVASHDFRLETIERIDDITCCFKRDICNVDEVLEHHQRPSGFRAPQRSRIPTASALDVWRLSICRIL